MLALTVVNTRPCPSHCLSSPRKHLILSDVLNDILCFVLHADKQVYRWLFVTKCIINYDYLNSDEWLKPSTNSLRMWQVSPIPPEQVALRHALNASGLSIAWKDVWEQKAPERHNKFDGLFRFVDLSVTGLLRFGWGESSRGAGDARRKETPCARRRGALQEMALARLRVPRASLLLLSLLRFWLCVSARGLDVADKDAPELICSEVPSHRDNPPVS